MANVEWLLREAMDERTLRMGERNAIDDARWRATIERLQLGPGLRVFLTDATARQDLTVEARDDRADRWMGSQVTIAGRADIDFLDGTRTHASADQAVLFRPSGRAAAYSLKAGTRFHSAGYGLDIERIVRLFDGEVPEALRGLIEGEVAQSRVIALRSDRVMRHLAGSLFGRGLNGPLRALMMEGAVIQLLAVQAAAAARRRSRHRGLAARDHDAIHEARRRLLADMRRPPSLGELAVGVGLSEKQLNAGFRLVYGETVFGVLRNERLAHAQIVLQSEAASLKEIAFRVGYNHVTNFITAFTARYGAPPRQYADSDFLTVQPSGLRA
ncbi:MAG TPA: AraC family transcriptional regulator [Reyranella sp.]|jgi:AraC-like DNA-binding protein|nr:AraC family transcriptional regulator [Reyranella sp.]